MSGLARPPRTRSPRLEGLAEDDLDRDRRGPRRGGAREGSRASSGRRRGRTRRSRGKRRRAGNAGPRRGAARRWRGPCGLCPRACQGPQGRSTHPLQPDDGLDVARLREELERLDVGDRQPAARERRGGPARACSDRRRRRRRRAPRDAAIAARGARGAPARRIEHDDRWRRRAGRRTSASAFTTRPARPRAARFSRAAPHASGSTSTAVNEAASRGEEHGERAAAGEELEDVPRAGGAERLDAASSSTRRASAAAPASEGWAKPPGAITQRGAVRAGDHGARVAEHRRPGRAPWRATRAPAHAPLATRASSAAHVLAGSSPRHASDTTGRPPAPRATLRRRPRPRASASTSASSPTSGSDRRVEHEAARRSAAISRELAAR